MGDTASTEDAITTALTVAEARIRRLFAEAMAALRAQYTEDEIAVLIASGRAAEVIADVDRAAERIAAEVNAELAASGRRIADAVASQLDQPLIRFDVGNPGAVDVMQANSLRLVRDIETEQATVLRTVISDGLAAGANPRAIARDIRATIGLTPTQAAEVQSYRRALEGRSTTALRRAARDRRSDSTVRAHARGERTLSQEQIDKLVDRYAARRLTQRAETIARTEALRAVHEAQQLAMIQAIARGDLAADQLTQEWLATGDGRTRSSHRAMGGQQQPWGGLFLSGDGNLLAYPGDPSAPASDCINCRCTTAVRISVATIATHLRAA